MGTPQVRGVDPPVMLTRGGAQASRINEAGDLVEERALGGDVLCAEHRAREHELPVQRQALALEERVIEALGVVDQGEPPLQGDQVNDRGEVGVSVGGGDNEARRPAPQGRHLGGQGLGMVDDMVGAEIPATVEALAVQV
jgi:hypothetical protein